jgi:hypothetical protein
MGYEADDVGEKRQDLSASLYVGARHGPRDEAYHNGPPTE